MKHAKINDVEGLGVAELKIVGSVRKCSGILVTTDLSGAMKLADEFNGTYTGTVVEGNKEGQYSFSIRITKTEDKGSEISIFFEASGNPYASA